jgi:ArsR family transcriptional regulator
MSVLPLVDVAPAAACCPPLSVQALPPRAAGELAPMFKALSDPIRLRLLSLIASTTEVCVCDLTDAFDVTGATISHHLRVLREASLVDGERRGTWVYYRVRQEALDLLGGLLLAGARADTPPVAAAAAGDPAPAPDDSGDGVISADSDVLRLVADPLRARIVEILAGGPASTSYLVAGTGAKQPNVSGHLKQLREAGVVEAESRGRYTFYRLVPESLRGGALHLADLAASARANAGTYRS